MPHSLPPLARQHWITTRSLALPSPRLDTFTYESDFDFSRVTEAPMQLTRRQLLHRSALTAGALCAAQSSTLLHAIPGLASEPSAPTADDSLFSRMTWFNEPASSKINGNELTVRSKPK